jgi:hypothetical protein
MAESTDKGPNYNSNGYLSQEGRVADEMSRSRTALHASHKRLQDFDKTIATAKKVIADGEIERPELVLKFQRAQKEHQAALDHYTNNIWMDIQVKPKLPPAPPEPLIS